MTAAWSWASTIVMNVRRFVAGSVFLLCLDLLGLIRPDMIEMGTFVLMVYLMNTFPMSLLTTDTTLLTFKLSYVHYTQLLPALQTETITRQGMINYTPKKNEKAFI